MGVCGWVWVWVGVGVGVGVGGCVGVCVCVRVCVCAERRTLIYRTPHTYTNEWNSVE